MKVWKHLGGSLIPIWCQGKQDLEDAVNAHQASETTAPGSSPSPPITQPVPSPRQVPTLGNGPPPSGIKPSAEEDRSHFCSFRDDKAQRLAPSSSPPGWHTCGSHPSTSPALLPAVFLPFKGFPRGMMTRTDNFVMHAGKPPLPLQKKMKLQESCNKSANCSESRHKSQGTAEISALENAGWNLLWNPDTYLFWLT